MRGEKVTLPPYGRKFNKDMSAEDAETLFPQAVPEWMGLRYKVAELRYEYLQRCLISSE